MSKSTKIVEMDDILKNILSTKISTVDFIEWLETNRSNISEFKSLQNSEFIPHFINCVKIKCSWFCRNDKPVDLEVNDNTKALTLNHISNGDTHANVEIRQSPFHPNNNIQKNNNGDFNQSANVIKEYNKKRVHTFTPNPQPYKQRGGFQRGYNINSNAFPPVSNKNYGREYPAQKWVENRKENCRNVVNKVGNFNVKPFIPEENKLQNINNFDAFPPLGSKPVDTKARRRITPTPVQTTSNFRTKFGNSHFTAVSENIPSEAFKCSAFQENTPNLQHERELLKATKNILPRQSGVPEAKSLTNHIDIKPYEKKSCDQFIYPDPENITMMREILCFSEIYSFLLKKSLVPNITSELYFLFELITSKTSAKDNLEKGDLFCSVHNCVYFAVSVLGNVCNLLQILDKATLTSLLEIPYLLKFSPQLVHFLSFPSLSKSEANVLLPSLTVVPFQIEEDSRANFPDEYSFVSFKRQRDLFYEMLREWQQATDCVDGKCQGTFVRKARQLISFNPNSINMFHLAKLFKSQLITSCMGLEVNDVYDELLNDIQRNLPDKFKKLQERFLAPSSSGKLTTSPSFYGIQTFFAELITAAGSLTLNQHLINIFVSKILELNNTDVFSDGELSSLGTVRDKYIFLLHTLRLLGKFLGYLYYLPYSKEDNIPAHIVNQQLSSRQHSSAPLNLPQLLKDSVNNGHTVLTIPWIVEFLSMIDPLGKKLNVIQEALTILTGIYRNTFSSHNLQSHLFLQVVIGWLFGILCYPDNFHLLLQPINLSFNSLSTGVDSLSVIDKQLIHSCCPYLIEFKVLVYNFLNGIKDKKREVRKITPLSTVNASSSRSSTMTTFQMEHHLEEHFFSLHPSSVKKTTEFISERMASKVISQIRSEITSMKLRIAEDVTNDELVKKSFEDLFLRRQCIDEILDKKIPEAFKDIQNKISLSGTSISSEINTIIPALLSTDTKDTVMEVSCKISYRMAVDKILDWCHANLLLEAIKTDIGNKVQHMPKDDAYGELKENSNLSERMSIVRSTVVKIHLQSYEFDLNNIKSMCGEMTNIIVSTVSRPIKKTFIMLSVDLYISLLTNYPLQCCEKLSQYFTQFWLKCPKHMTVGKLLICPQNLKFLLMSKNFDLALKHLMSSVKILFDNKVFSFEELDAYMKEIKELTCSNFIENSIKELLFIYEMSFQYC